MDPPTIQQAQQGNRQAQAALLRWLADPLFRLSLGLLGDADLAREAVQETALRILRELPKFNGQSQFRTWAMGIAINVARELRRRNRAPVRIWREENVLDPAAQAEQNELAGSVRHCLGNLPQRQREALLLRFFEDLSVEETARTMQCAPGTVKATVHQALRALKEKLTGKLRI